MHLFITLFLLLQAYSGLSQTGIKITPPGLKVANGNIVIEYDILNSKQNDLFLVRIEVTDSLGNPIDTYSLSGDIGDQVKGGINKKIIWDLKKDGISQHQKIFVQIKAERNINAKNIKLKDFSYQHNTAGLILYSAILPGAGLTKINNGKPYWLMGVATYGCAATSFYYFKKSESTFEDYKNSWDIDESKTLFDQAQKEDNIYKVLAISAAGIWVTNMIWTSAIAGKKYRSIASRDTKGFSVGSTYDPYTKKPLLSLTYSF